MKSLIILLAGMTGLFAAEAPNVKTLEIGAAAPAFTLTGVDDKKHSLADFKDSNYLVMIFTCNHCPDARASWGRINSFAKTYADKGVQVVAVSTNSPKALMPWENGYSVYGDSFPEMKQVSAEREFVFPYLYDGDTQEVGLAYGAQATPHVFIFGPKRKLLYEGHFDNGHRNPGPASQNTVRDNIDALLAGKPVIKQQTNVFGCSTKWAYKQEWAVKKQKEWEALPVTVEKISVDGVKSLLSNKTGNIRMIHIWGNAATVGEYFPELMDTYRRYQKRSFDYTTIVIDPEDDIDAVHKHLTMRHVPTSPDSLKTLKKEGRTTINYLLQKSDLKTLSGMIGGDKPMKLPCTIIVAPGGGIIHREDQVVDAVELRRAIVKGIEGL